MIRAAVIGATGYTGAELVRILQGHPQVRLSLLTSRQYAGERFDRIYPAMSGRCDLVCRPYQADAVIAESDVAFTALPHKLPMEIVPALLEGGVKVIDLSADFRFSDPQLYESHYQPHVAAALLERAVYGLSEVYGQQIRQADLVGNPGCYPTSILLPLIPLVRAGMVATDSLVADAKSGVSGAGRSPSVTTHFCEVQESFKAYKVGVHRHNPEIDMVLSRHAGTGVHITFVPHLVPMSRGMFSTIYARLRRPARREEIVDLLRDFYRQRPFVRVRAERLPDTLQVRGGNYCDIGVRVEEDGRRLILLSVIDNLVKGASGQAVQNMNLMFGLDEGAGLLNMPYAL